MKMHTLSLAAVPVALLLAGCAPAATPEPTFTSAPPPVPLPTTTPEPTPTPEPTATPTPALAPDSKQIAACQPDPTLSGESPYPAPTGPYQVGVTAFQLVDDTRPEPFTTDATDYRVVTIFVWYPAEVAGDAEPCSYTSTFDLENSDFDGLVALYAGDVDSTYRRLSAWTLVAYPDATAASDQPRYPVVIYSNILAGLPISQSSQFQELASQGYIAIDVLHTYGYPVDCCFKVNGVTINLGSHERLAGNDILFVLDQLAELDANQPANALAGRFDLDQIGVAGWSSGGPAVIMAASADDRVKAGIAFDGEPQSARTLRQPFLFMSRRGGSTYAAAQGPAYHLAVEGFAHDSYGDMVLWPERCTTASCTLLGTIDGLRAIEILNAYIVAFFDQYLRGIDQPLLDGPSPDYPEVTIESRNAD